MIFSSPRFLVFLILVLIILTPAWPRERKKTFLLIASCTFYAAWDYRYLSILAAISILDYWVANRIAASTDAHHRRAWLLLSVTSNLGILSYFKYYNFFIDNLNLVGSGLGLSFQNVNILLPAGISFYTFKTLSYTIDVYRGELRPVGSLRDYAMFVTFFPELIAGPIVRASVFLPQMEREIGPTIQRLSLGASMFAFGMLKKILIADRLALVVDPIFADPALYSASTLWAGAAAYSMQIYCDFSGYSDMAIGVAKMVGYDLPENFRMPYLSTSITEFWRRWHITLSTWLRDYLYIPLGGNRRGEARTYVNLAITMLLGGLWHGASWNFVLWGGMHGVALALHRAYRNWLGTRRGMPGWIGWLLTLVFVVLCWVPFRSPTFTLTMTMFARMSGFYGTGAVWIAPVILQSALALVLAHAAGVALAPRRVGYSRITEAALRFFSASVREEAIAGTYVQFGTKTVAGVVLIECMVLALFFFAPKTVNPFIYFQF